nr:hypothetical protein [Glycomyces arizonensis]
MFVTDTERCECGSCGSCGSDNEIAGRDRPADTYDRSTCQLDFHRGCVECGIDAKVSYGAFEFNRRK